MVASANRKARRAAERRSQIAAEAARVLIVALEQERGVRTYQIAHPIQADDFVKIVQGATQPLPDVSSHSPVLPFFTDKDKLREPYDEPHDDAVTVSSNGEIDMPDDPELSVDDSKLECVESGDATSSSEDADDADSHSPEYLHDSGDSNVVALAEGKFIESDINTESVNGLGTCAASRSPVNTPAASSTASAIADLDVLSEHTGSDITVPAADSATAPVEHGISINTALLPKFSNVPDDRSHFPYAEVYGRSDEVRAVPFARDSLEATEVDDNDKCNPSLKS
jgi:hypothetical protein